MRLNDPGEEVSERTLSDIRAIALVSRDFETSSSIHDLDHFQRSIFAASILSTEIDHLIGETDGDVKRAMIRIQEMVDCFGTVAGILRKGGTL